MNTPVNINTLHANMKTALAAQFPTCTVDYYPRPGDKITTPAILLELDDIEADKPDDMGTEQVPVTMMWRAYVVRDYKQGSKLAARTLAASVMAFIRGKRWSAAVGRAVVIGAFPDKFGGDSLEYECMRVEFEHEGILGTDVWIDDGDVPTEVNVSEQGNEPAVIVEAED
jgi:hypothetical protein